MQVIKDVIIIFLVSLPIVFLFRKINMPSIVGFLIAGIFIGPYGFKWISEIHSIEVLAEIGVVLLLFTIGLEVSISKLSQMKKLLTIGGGMQVLVTLSLSALFFYFLNLPLEKCIFFGMLISLSSTAIVLRLLSEKNELNAPHGKIALGILIFQDLAIVPMMLLLPILGAGEDLSVTLVLIKLGTALVFLVVTVLVSKFIMPKLLFQLAKMQSREAFIIGVILLILGTAYLTEMIGLSFALGAFIAGLVLSETEFSHQVTAEILPFKDAFNSLFFVSIGLLLDYSFVAKYPLIIIALVFGLIFFKATVIFVITILMKYPSRVAIISGITLAQIGEFSFVLAQGGNRFNLIGENDYSAFLAASIFTMLLTPLLMQIAPKLAVKMQDKIKDKHGEVPDKVKLKDHVIIAGFGINGQNIARVLRETGIRYVIIDLNPETVKQKRKEKETIFFGDITRREVLEEAYIKEANTIVFTISDPYSTRIGLQIAKSLNPEVYTIIRTRFINEVEELIKLGADEVIPEEFETSLQIFTKVLQKYHIPVNIIMRMSNILRSESYQLLRKDPSAIQSLSHLDKILAEGVTEIYYVEDSNSFINKTLSEINFRALTGATIISILRDGTNINNPAGEEKILSKDNLIIYGTHNSVDKAIDLLDSKK